MGGSFDGLRVRIGMSDPWDFVTENGSWVTGRIVSLIDAEFKIDLDVPVKEGKSSVATVFGRPRHANYTPASLLRGESVPFNFSNYSSEDWKRAAPGARIGFIGSLQLASAMIR